MYADGSVGVLLAVVLKVFLRCLLQPLDLKLQLPSFTEIPLRGGGEGEGEGEGEVKQEVKRVGIGDVRR